MLGSNIHHSGTKDILPKEQDLLFIQLPEPDEYVRWMKCHTQVLTQLLL